MLYNNPYLCTVFLWDTKNVCTYLFMNSINLNFCLCKYICNKIFDFCNICTFKKNRFNGSIFGFPKNKNSKYFYFLETRLFEHCQLVVTG